VSVGVPTPFDPPIEAAIAQASAQGLAQLAAAGRDATEARYVIKYTSARFGGRYPPGPNAVAGAALYISPSPGFTWGAGVYACPVAYPLSGGIYGRCGIVAELADSAGWRLFDAADPATAGLYVGWAQRQPMYVMLTLTAHAALANQLLRNMFRQRFGIDVVVFRPDEFHARYTRRQDDRWLALSEWASPGRLMTSGGASRALQPRLTVILAEEFEPTRSGIRRQAFIGPTPFLAAMAPTPADVINAYQAASILWVGA
jgi:hypothetical protein